MRFWVPTGLGAIWSLMGTMYLLIDVWQVHVGIVLGCTLSLAVLWAAFIAHFVAKQFDTKNL